MEKITARMSEIFAYFLVVGLGLSPTRMMNIVRQVREEKKILTVQAHVDTAEDRTTEGAENQEKQRIRFARVCCDSDLDRVGLLRVNNFWRRRYPRLLLFHVGNMDVIGVDGAVHSAGRYVCEADTDGNVSAATRSPARSGSGPR